MDTNPYRPPVADVELPPGQSNIPTKVLKDIRNAWITALVSGTITLLASLIGMTAPDIGFNAWNLLDAVLIFKGLAYGIYRKNRTCALIMLIYFFASKIMLFMDGLNNMLSIFFGLVFIYFYFKGVTGTFAYHKHLKQQ